MFMSGDAQEIVDIKKDRLQQWIHQELISPSIKEADGAGGRNLWSQDDLYVLAMFKEVFDAGWTRKVAGRFYKALKTLRAGAKELQVLDATFIVFMRKGEKVEATYTTETRLDFSKFMDVDDIYFVNFRKLKKRIDTRIAKHVRGFFKKKQSEKTRGENV